MRIQSQLKGIAEFINTMQCASPELWAFTVTLSKTVFCFLFPFFFFLFSFFFSFVFLFFLLVSVMGLNYAKKNLCINLKVYDSPRFLSFESQAAANNRKDHSSMRLE